MEAWEARSRVREMRRRRGGGLDCGVGDTDGVPVVYDGEAFEALLAEGYRTIQEFALYDAEVRVEQVREDVPWSWGTLLTRLSNEIVGKPADVSGELRQHVASMGLFPVEGCCRYPACTRCREPVLVSNGRGWSVLLSTTAAERSGVEVAG